MSGNRLVHSFRRIRKAAAIATATCISLAAILVLPLGAQADVIGGNTFTIGSGSGGVSTIGGNTFTIGTGNCCQYTIGGNTFTIGTAGGGGLDIIGGNTFTITEMGLSTAVVCAPGGMSAYMPVLPQRPAGARFEYWYPKFYTDPQVVTWPQNPTTGYIQTGTLGGEGPLFAADLQTGAEYYENTNGVWISLPNATSIIHPQLGSVNFVQDWVEYVAANGSIVSGWTNEGFRADGAYQGDRHLWLTSTCVY